MKTHFITQMTYLQKLFRSVDASDRQINSQHVFPGPSQSLDKVIFLRLRRSRQFPWSACSCFIFLLE